MRASRPGYWSLAVVLFVAAGCAEPVSPAPTRTPPAAPAARAAKPSAVETAKPVPSPAPDLVVERHEMDRPGLQLSAKVGGCELYLTVEKKGMWWRAEALPDGGPGECEVLNLAYREAWAALAREARKLGMMPESLGLTIDFYNDLPGIEQWFRYQAGNPELQKRAQDERNAEYIRLLPVHLLTSGALFRYSELLGAMGLSIERISLEKVEVRAARKWLKYLPASRLWELDPASRLALPFFTWLKLRRK
jgi:hypothetical protein